MYIKLLIILFESNVSLFALQLFDCENSYFWNPFYFISQNKYINWTFLPLLFKSFLFIFGVFSLYLFQPLPLFLQCFSYSSNFFFVFSIFFYITLIFFFFFNMLFLLISDSIEKVKQLAFNYYHPESLKKSTFSISNIA